MVRTTLTIDDGLLRELRLRAAQAGVPLKVMIDRVLRAGLLAAQGSRRRRRFQPLTFDMGTPPGGLVKALQVAAELENEEILRKAALRK